MNRYDLKGTSEATMAEHIEDGRANRGHIYEHPEPMTALSELMARGDFIWAVWPENDVRKPKVLGHALAIIKGIPLMQRISDRKLHAQLETVTILFDSHSAACTASAMFGDDRPEAA